MQQSTLSPTSGPHAPRAPRTFRRRGADTSGAVLLIVLDLMVLLLVVALAYFTTSTSERQVSDSSANDARVNLLAQGVGDQIIADLEHEIAVGSTNIGTTSNPVYVPKTFTAMIQAMPARSGSNSLGGMPPNVLKRSAYAQPFYPANAATYDTSGANRASADSTTNPTRTGRSVTLARWNASLLLPKANGASGTDLTPVTTGTNGFVAPDWIYVTAQGGNPVLTGTVPAANTVTGSDPVIGRYAYVIYHEGGLLDMNVAGYPLGASATTNQMIISFGAKPVPAYVDLRAIPGIGTNDPVTGAGSLTAVNQTNLTSLLLGWRNYASSGASGTMGSLAWPGYTFISGLNYFTNMIGATNGFLTTARVPLNSGQSDRSFTSRQQLIQFLQDAAGTDTAALASLQNALQYLGTFSRSLEQPSYVPPLWYTNAAPKIPNGIGTAPAYTNYTGGNNAWTNAFTADTNINVVFPCILATTNFTRNVSDLSGATTAFAGEPLVKKRFPLERLAWLTYKGPSAGRSPFTEPDMVSLLTNPGVTAALLAQGTAANIQRSFGLTWNAAGYWEYNPATGSAGSIATLGSLAGTRDPNFAELLKAALCAGSLGKSTGISTLQGGQGAGLYADTNMARSIHLRDTSVDYHVLRMMANIIDQSDADGYPTTIRFASSSPNPTNQVYLINGIENLPYIYRTRNLAVRAKEGRYINSSGATTNYPVGGTNCILGTIVNQGVGVMLMIPEIWNPHDQNSSLGTPYPTDCRIIAENWEGIPTNFPATALNATNTNRFDVFVGGRNGNDSDYSNASVTPVPAGFTRPDVTDTNLTPDNSALLISLPTNAPGFFRDPTSLHRAGIPSGSALRLAPTHMLQPANFTRLLTDSLFSDVMSADGSGVSEGASDTNGGRIGFYLGCFPLLSQFLLTNITTTYTRAANGTVSAAATTNITTNVGFGYLGGWTTNPTATNTFGGLTYTNTAVSNSFVPWEVSTYVSPNYINKAGVFTLRMQYADPINSGSWCDYDVKTWDLADDKVASGRELKCALAKSGDNSANGYWRLGFMSAANVIDPRTGRFGLIFGRSGGTGPTIRTPNVMPLNDSVSLTTWATAYGNTLGAQRFSTNGYFSYPAANYGLRGTGGQGSPNANFSMSGLNQADRISLNTFSDGYYYGDADGVIRRGMGAYATGTIGLPTLSATVNFTSLSQNPSVQSQSRSIILNRPFRSVAELGYVFSDLPWRQLNFFTPESGNLALLDSFCIRDQSDADGLSAGKVNLNSRQAPVLQAVMAGGMIDELLRSGTTARTLSDTNVSIAASDAASMSTNLVSRTATNTLYNVSDLVGRWVSGTGSSAVYDGFSRDINLGNTTNNVIQRFREAPIRALANTGQTRVWNLMIDIMAQTGKFPPGATGFNQFIVTGEKRLWLHVAIDRVTGNVLDSTVEPVNE